MASSSVLVSGQRRVLLIPQSLKIAAEHIHAGGLVRSQHCGAVGHELLLNRIAVLAIFHVPHAVIVCEIPVASCAVHSVR